MPRRFAWASLPDEELLKLRFKNLKVTIEGTWLETCLRELYRELRRRGLKIRPHAWLSDEWFSPDNTPGIAIPFYLAHPRFMRLERKKIIDVEGGSMRECMRILRHEAGHVMQHAYRLQQRRRWRELFGASSTPYPKYYRPSPRSKRYVQHLRQWYAQSHPDEDFAETFAVWLTPRSAWRKRYAGWPALKKLQYVDELMAEITAEMPSLTRRREVDPIHRLNRTLAEHYKKKQALYVVDSWKTYDRDLRRIFSSEPGRRPLRTAAAFLRKNRGKIRRRVSKATGEYQLTLDAVLDEMIGRCHMMKLWAVGSERKLIRGFTVLLTAKTVHSLYSPSRRSFAL
ncbi:MAG: putative zinc-binding metallopeptidase [Xanthobacteraceae bacterium]